VQLYRPLQQLAQARDQGSWNALMAPALAQLNCRVIQSTSDEAPGLLAYVEHYLEAHHSPDVQLYRPLQQQVWSQRRARQSTLRPRVATIN
jgi:hypothetical protein